MSPFYLVGDRSPLPKEPTEVEIPKDKLAKTTLIVPVGWDIPIFQKKVDIFKLAKDHAAKGAEGAKGAEQVEEIKDDELEPPLVTRQKQWELKATTGRGRARGRGRGRGRGKDHGGVVKIDSDDEDPKPQPQSKRRTKKKPDPKTNEPIAPQERDFFISHQYRCLTLFHVDQGV